MQKLEPVSEASVLSEDPEQRRRFYRRLFDRLDAGRVGIRVRVRARGGERVRVRVSIIQYLSLALLRSMDCLLRIRLSLGLFSRLFFCLYTQRLSHAWSSKLGHSLAYSCL